MLNTGCKIDEVEAGDVGLVLQVSWVYGDHILRPPTFNYMCVCAWARGAFGFP